MAYLGTLIIIYLIPKDKEKKLIALIIAGLNPYLILTFIHGQNDIFIFFLIISSLFLLHKKRQTWSLILLGLACASKQYAWLIIPFYFFYFYYLKQDNNIWQKILYSLKKFIPAFISFFIFVIPFFIWSPIDLLKDTLFFGLGGLKTSFPVSGNGLAGLLVQRGLIKSLSGFSITYLFQLAFSLPLLIWLIRKLRSDNSVANITFFYALFTFTFLITSRFFNDSLIPFFALLTLSGWAFQNSNN